MIRFSVAIPVYEHADYLLPAVLSALRSPLVSEVLLVDDGSRDGSAQRAAELADRHPGRVRDLTRPGEGNRGTAARLNQLVAAAREDWVAILDSDDAFVPGRFELLERRLRRGGAAFACGHLLVMDAAGKVFGTKRGVLEPEYPFPRGARAFERAARGELAPLLAHQNFVATTSNMVFTRALHERVGGFADLRYVHDWDFALRAALADRCLYLPQYLSIYRRHPRNTIRDAWSETCAEVRRLFRRVLDEHPQLPEQPLFQAALRANRYLAAAQG